MPPHLVKVAHPRTLDAPEAWALRGVVRVREAIDREIRGHHDVVPDLARSAAMLADRRYRVQERVVAVLDDSRTPESVVGHASIILPQVGHTNVALVDVGVAPRWRGHGIGGLLAEELARRARAAGRTVVQADTSHAPVVDDGAAVLEAPTGAGAVPADTATTRFLLRHDFTLEQVERMSTLPMPMPPDLLDRLSADASAVAGTAYRMHTWVGGIPADRQAQYARLLTRMSTAAPSAGLEQEEDPWDVPRLQEALARQRQMGWVAVVVAAEHVATGELAGYTVAEYADTRPEAVLQQDTLVLPEHRGHRLGMLVKTHLMRTLAAVRPHARRIHTWNAEENAPMLAINVALGYRPSCVGAQWQRRLEEA
ncbi:GNAT family N-acetyltransferase [Mumia quercus]|uniref:GNAT family N-acetyltransferase n=1 Tax=Mumia quercus TaxID=2976125 RepID=UPI0021D0ADA0|nr:GNAT family N-acetyltransferase [Mumia quercus]